MGLRVGLVIVGVVIYYVLREYGLPRGVAIGVGFLPFLLAEAKGLVPGPYEKSAHDVMHESSGPDDGTPPGQA